MRRHNVQLIVTHKYYWDHRTEAQRLAYERAMSQPDQKLEEIWRERVRQNEVRRHVG